MQKKRKGGGDHSFLYLPLYTSGKCSNLPLPPSLPPSISTSPLHLHLLIFPSSPTSLILSIRPLCVLQSLQQSAHLENPQLPSSISSAHISHAHTHTPQNIPLYKGAIKTTSFPPVFCLKKLVISFNCASLCAEQYVFQCFLSDCLK